MGHKVQGADQLKAKLQRFPKLAEAEIRKAMEASANELVTLAKSIVPVDDGDLQASIGWTWGAAPKGSVAIGKVSGGTGGRNLVITIYAGNEKAFWARWVEFGTRPHINGGWAAGTQHPGTRATGFFYGSYRSLRKRMRSRTARAIRKAAKSAAAGGGVGP